MRRAAFVLALLAVLALPAGTVVATFGPATEPASPAAGSDSIGDPSTSTQFVVSADSFAQQAQPTGEWRGKTEIVVSLRSDRDARWQVVTRYSLDSANETAVFRRYAEAFEAGQTSGGLSAEMFRYIANTSAETAGRPMTIRNVSRSARVDDGTGVLVLSFTWTNFLEASPESDLLVLRDAFILPGDRTWLETLQPDQQLVIRTPPGYALNYSSVPVQPVSGSVVIDGPRDFSGDEPLTIRYQPTSAAEQLPWELIIGSLVGLIVVALVMLRRRGELGGGGENDQGGEAVGGGPLSGAGGAGPEETEGGEPTAGKAGVPETGATGATGTGESPPSEAEGEAEVSAEEGEAEPEVDLSLLSDEERVEHLLEQRGGRMRQAKIVEETGWSDAKVSQLLSAMAEEGHIEKLRIGRENLISLPEADLTNGGEGDDSNDTGSSNTADDSGDETGAGSTDER